MSVCCNKKTIFSFLKVLTKTCRLYLEDEKDYDSPKSFEI
jgi:hypothetical protein